MHGTPLDVRPRSPVSRATPRLENAGAVQQAAGPAVVGLQMLHERHVAALARMRSHPSCGQGLLAGLLDTHAARQWALDLLSGSRRTHATQGVGMWAVVDAATPRCIGVVGFCDTDVPGALTLFYLVDPAHRGRGVATAAVRVALGRWRRRGGARVHAFTRLENTASQRVALRSGLAHAGLHRHRDVPCHVFTLDPVPSPGEPHGPAQQLP